MHIALPSPSETNAQEYNFAEESFDSDRTSDFSTYDDRHDSSTLKIQKPNKYDNK